MPLPLAAAWFAILLISTGVWFALVASLFRQLRDRHPETFVELGSPALFRNNTPANNLRLLKFLFSSASKRLNDARIAHMVQILRVYLILHLAGLTAFVVAFLTRGIAGLR
ncbi:MAG: hypothetical protein CMJ58_19945 [Planctomycetaceae bacterium]|nr:hypothetical protein [Planctomycetaceae bacterium]